MKIAIFHNLRTGGGLEYIEHVVTELYNKSITVDVFTHQQNKIDKSNKTYYYPLQPTSNIFKHVSQVLVETNTTEREMAHRINNEKYNFVFVFPCHLQQCPNIINYLPKNNTYYFYFESLREHYEKTSFDYYSIKKIISRTIRFPIKIQDLLNCSKATNIISNSYYSNYILEKVYKKTSNVVYPGMVRTSPQKLIISNKNTKLSFGQLSMLKGHHISASITPNMNIFGLRSHENIKVRLHNSAILHDEIIDNKDKFTLYKRFTYFFANQINEPFGLTTLEATQNNCYIIGRNEAGTCEIVSNGVNGLLYNINNLRLSRELFQNIENKQTILLYKITKINWTETIDNIINIISYV